MEELQIGKLAKLPHVRDAIHIAVLSVMAGREETLLPGQHIGFAEGGHWVTAKPSPPYQLVGIVDPFLDAPVKGLEAFWMFLYPQTITGLRHDWSHPTIAGNGAGMKSYAEKWLMDFADSVGASYWEMMRVAATHCEDAEQAWPDYLCEGGRWEGQDTPNEFWVHFEAVTGKKPKGWEGGQGVVHLPGIFTCSC